MEKASTNQQVMYLLHSPYENGTWRGIHKCVGADEAPDAVCLLFEDRESAKKHLNSMPEDLREYWHIVPVMLAMPDVGSRLDAIED